MTARDGDQREPEQALTMLDALPEPIARYRVSDLTIVYCNRAKAVLYGRSPQQLTGRRLDEILPPDDLQRLQTHLAQLGEDNPTLTDLVEVAGDDGSRRWIEWVDRWYPGPDGPEVLSLGRDVTDRVRTEHELRASEERFRIAMQDAPIGMALVGLDARLLEVNAALCRFLGRDRDELLTMTTLDVTHPDDVEEDLAYGRESLRGDTHRELEKRYLRPDGSVVWGSLKVSTVWDQHGRPLYEIGQVVDITARREHEQQLERLAASEHAAAERLRALDDVKNAFLTAVSHELRTPLTVVHGMASTLGRLSDELSAERRAELVRALEEHSARLTGLLDELLDVDRLIRGAMGTERVRTDVAAFVRELTASHPRSERVTVEAPETLWAEIDRIQIERIVANLLGNADKYAPEGPVTVRCSAASPDRVAIEVIDAGPGVPAQDRERIFDAFDRGIGDHPQPGTGIGLALVQEFARLHGGTARVVPSDHGAHFVVELSTGSHRNDAHEP